MRVKKEFIVKESEGYRLRIEAQECLSPKELINLDFIQESLNKDGIVDHTSTYNFHMTKEEIKDLCDGLMQI
jgi:hypothetical protein